MSTNSQAGTESAMREVELAIDGMTCGHCLRAVQTAAAGVPGVEVKSVKMGSAVLAVPAGGGQGALDSVIAALGEEGYSARVASGTRPNGGGRNCCGGRGDGACSV